MEEEIVPVSEPVVQLQLQERVVNGVASAYGSDGAIPRRGKFVVHACARDGSIYDLRRRHAAARQGREDVLKIRNGRRRFDRSVLFAQLDHLAYGGVPINARRWINQIVQMHDVTRHQQITPEAADVAGFKGETFPKVASIGEIECVAARRDDRVIQSGFDPLILVGGLLQRKIHARIYTYQRESGVANVIVEAIKKRT